MATRIRAVSFNPYTGCTTGSFVGSAAVVAISPVEIELGRINGVSKGRRDVRVHYECPRHGWGPIKRSQPGASAVPRCSTLWALRRIRIDGLTCGALRSRESECGHIVHALRRWRRHGNSTAVTAIRGHRHQAKARHALRWPRVAGPSALAVLRASVMIATRCVPCAVAIATAIARSGETATRKYLSA